MDILDELMEIGFTEYEAKVYAALLRESPANGYQISKKSGVPRSMVYEALGRLHARGAVLETIQDRAAMYRPLPPGALLDRHAEEHGRVIAHLREGLDKIYAAPAEEGVWTISGSRAVHSYAVQMIRAAEVELLLVLNDADLETLRGEIAAACGRGIEINALLTGAGVLDCGRVAYHPPLESEMQELTTTLVVVADGRETLIGSTAGEGTATTTQNRNLVMIARQFVWMEMFTQRIHARLGSELLSRLDDEDRRIFESRGGG